MDSTTLNASNPSLTTRGGPPGKPKTVWGFLVHAMSVAGLFVLYNGLYLYLDKGEVPKETEMVVTSAPAKVSPAAVQLSSPLAGEGKVQGKTKKELLDNQNDSLVVQGPVPSAAPLSLEKTPKITKKTTCPELNDVIDYWKSVAKRPRTAEGEVWLKERMQEAMNQKRALGCAD